VYDGSVFDDWKRLFDFETNPEALGADRLRRIGLLGRPALSFFCVGPRSIRVGC
jgi:hypothetical protein